MVLWPRTNPIEQFLHLQNAESRGQRLIRGGVTQKAFMALKKSEPDSKVRLGEIWWDPIIPLGVP